MPKVDTSSILELLPHLDCSLCGNPTCEAMARRILNKEQSYAECPLFTVTKEREIEDRLSKYSKNNFNSLDINERIVELQPCAEYGKVTLEARLPSPSNSPHHQLFAPCEMCALFQDVPLEKARCSRDMGYAYYEQGQKGIHVFNTGKIIIRRAADRADAFSTLDKLIQMLWPAVVCSCGSPFSDCLGGGCPSCDSQSCPALAWGLKEEKLTINSVGNLLNEANDELVMKAFQKMDTIVRELEKVIKNPRNNDKNWITEKRKLFQSLLRDLIIIGTRGIIQSSTLQSNLLFVLIHSIERNFRRITEGVFSSIDNAVTTGIETCYSYVKDGYQALRENDCDFAQKIMNKYQLYMNKQEITKISPDLFKIMKNGYNLARSCTFTF